MGLGFLLGAGLRVSLPGLVINALLMWFIANFMMNMGEKIPFRKCLLCAFLLMIVTMLGVACMAIPITIVNMVLAGVVFYKGSLAVIEGSFEINKGSFTFLGIYTFTTIGLWFVLIGMTI